MTLEELSNILEETNPADIVMDVLTESHHNAETLDWLIERFDADFRPALEVSIASAMVEGPSQLELVKETPNIFTQLWALTGRFYEQSSVAIMVLPIVTSVFAGTLFGLMFMDDIDGQIMAAAMYKSMLSGAIFAPFAAANFSMCMKVIEHRGSNHTLNRKPKP